MTLLLRRAAGLLVVLVHQNAYFVQQGFLNRIQRLQSRRSLFLASTIVSEKVRVEVCLQPYLATYTSL